jgi:hypothetical protein
VLWYQVKDGQLVYAHWGKNSVESVTIPPPASSSGGTPVVLVPSSLGVKCPTSVRYGDGSPDFPATSLFVTEGCLLSKSNRVVRVDL